MEVRNCKGCNRLFQYIGGVPLCHACKEALEDKFTEVKEYIYENPGQSIVQVAEATEVTTKQIKQWIREERLVLSDASPDGITCESCGTPIRSGRFCDKCKVQMTNDFNTAVGRRPVAPVPEKKTEKTGNKMRFLSKE